MVAGEGFEPTTPGYEPGKLPDCSNPRWVRSGFEPTSSRLKVMRSSQLSYEPVCAFTFEESNLRLLASRLPLFH